MGTSASFDWPALMGLGMRKLGLPPDVFWALSPAELMFLLGLEATDAPMGRRRLEELQTAHPDVGAGVKGQEHDAAV